MAKLSSESYKGARDWYPEDMRVREYIFDTWKKVVKSYGYEPYDAPLLEPVEVYAAKSGQELVNEQTYQFTDRGDRHVAIRPEMTPSVSRMIAARRQETPLPARWYSIAQFMRYERPQRGREREFWQLNVDMFGGEGAVAEAEIISLGVAIMKQFGATDDMYIVRVNNRKVINYMMAHYLGLDADQSQAMVKLFDRKNKISTDSFRNQAAEIFGDDAKAGLQKIAQLLAAKTMADLPESIRDSEAVREVQNLFTYLERAGIKNASFDITLMRGLDYYTGTVFEFFDTHPENNRSLFGGGRYDGLVSVFGAEPLTAVGVAPGLTTTQLFLESHNLLPDIKTGTIATVLVLGSALTGAQDLAQELRQKGINIDVDFTDRKLDKKLKAALKKQVPYLIFVGEDEVESGTYTVKDAMTGEESKLSKSDLISKLSQAIDGEL
jgi:histidyl-tRNA synthetase